MYRKNETLEVHLSPCLFLSELQNKGVSFQKIAWIPACRISQINKLTVGNTEKMYTHHIISYSLTQNDLWKTKWMKKKTSIYVGSPCKINGKISGWHQFNMLYVMVICSFFQGNKMICCLSIHPFFCPCELVVFYQFLLFSVYPIFHYNLVNK